MPARHRCRTKTGIKSIMNQQINLYQPMFRKQKKVFSAVAMVQVFVIVLILFSLTGAYSYMQLNQLRQQDLTAKRNLETLQQRIAALGAQSADDIEIRIIETELAKISKEIKQKKQISDLLSQGAFTNTTGFSDYFEAIARQHVNGTWLTRISIEQGGAILSLNGVASSAELVPVYLQRLLQEQVFSGISFNVLGLERSVTEPGEINFQVGTGIDGNSDESS